MPERARIALTLGDPAGIGPEIALRASLEPEVRAVARLVLIGPADLRPDGVPALAPGAPEYAPGEAPGPALAAAWEVAWSEHAAEDRVWIEVPAREPWEPGRPQAAAGRVALASLRAGALLAAERVVDALVTAPVSKEALHLAGERCEGQTELLGRWAGCPEVEMLAIAHELRVLLLTRHLPLRDALARIERGAVVRHLALLDQGLRALGIARPRLALAGLNPHAGEAGLLGSEEQDLLAPAVREARALGLDVQGPEPPDTVFLRASRGGFDGVLALYHDQAFIPVKLHAPDEGLTVLVGLPYLRVSPAHGTAFDIAGRGVARHANLVLALLQAARWSAARRAGAGLPEGRPAGSGGLD